MQAIPQGVLRGRRDRRRRAAVRQFFSDHDAAAVADDFFVSVISVIGSLQLFDLVYVMVGSGPAARATRPPRLQTVVQLFYEGPSSSNDGGYAAAIAIAAARASSSR